MLTDLIMLGVAVAQELHQVTYEWKGGGFDPWPLQSACQISLGKTLTRSYCPMHPSERECERV